MSLSPHPRVQLHIDAPSAAPLTLALVVVAALLIAVAAAVVQLS